MVIIMCVHFQRSRCTVCCTGFPRCHSLRRDRVHLLRALSVFPTDCDRAREYGGNSASPSPFSLPVSRSPSTGSPSRGFFSSGGTVLSAVGAEFYFQRPSSSIASRAIRHDGRRRRRRRRKGGFLLKPPRRRGRGIKEVGWRQAKHL